MYNSNSFNICTRCGTANSLSAKYCFQCGGQLKVPEEPVVCPKCHTVNTGMANFCRHCGSTLKVGAQTKLCPKCNKEVPFEQSQCYCGYSFATVRQVNPIGGGNVAETRTPIKDKSTLPLNKRGGRAVALIAMILLVAILAVVSLPQAYRPAFLSSLGIIQATMSEGGIVALNMYDIVVNSIASFMSPELLTYTVGGWTVMVMTIIAYLCMGIHLIVVVVRLFTSRRSRKANIFYLTMTILTGIAVGLIALASSGIIVADSFLAFLNVFALPSGQSIGYLMYAIPGYFLFFFIFSLFAKVKKDKAI